MEECDLQGVLGAAESTDTLSYYLVRAGSLHGTADVQGDKATGVLRESQAETCEHFLLPIIKSHMCLTIWGNTILDDSFHKCLLCSEITIVLNLLLFRVLVTLNSL